MPFLDRHWWLRVLLACGASVLALAYVVWCVRMGLSIPPQSPFPIGALTLGVFIPMLLFGVAKYAVVAALPARRRLRLAAIRGDREAVPASLIVPHPERAPEVAVELVGVAWRPLTFKRPETAPLRAALALGLGLLLLLTFFASVGSTMASYHSFPEVFLHTALSALLVTLFMIAFLVIVVIIASVWSGVVFSGIASPILAFFAKPFDVAADVNGVTAHNSRGQEHRVRWDDARLLEVSVAPRVLGRYRVFTLYGRDTYARWRDDTGSDVAAPLPLDGITREEASKRLQSLLDLIAARTGLTPRTFDDGLAVARRSRVPRMVQSVANMLPMMLGCIAVALVSIRFPLTNAAILNTVTSAAYFIFAAIWLVFAFIPGRRPPATAQGHERIDDTGADSIYQDSQQAYAIYTTITRSSILAALLISLLAWLAALQLLFAWLGMLGVSTFRAIQFSPLWPSQSVAIVVALIGGAGLLVFIATIATFFAKPRTPVVYADAEGIHTDNIADKLFLAWDAVDGITRSPSDTRHEVYTVIGNYGRTKITWSDRSATPAQADLRFHAVTPEQFAAIVVARSGKQLTVR